jgi:cyclopropane-fatty-acyl-phospholipid synthase
VTGKQKRIVARLLSHAGVVIDGGRPWDIRVHEEALYGRILRDGSLGLGESYVDGWWDCDRLDEFFFRVLRAELDSKVQPAKLFWAVARARLFNLQKPSRAFIIGKRHYDTGNELYIRMLDRGMNYSCGYWKDADNLDDAQEAKLDLISKKLGLKEGMRLLDIGCGWGGAVKLAAERYGVEAVGITVSEEQAKLARERCAGLPVEIRLQDYRELSERFDRIFSIGMFEHVGPKNYGTFMKVVRESLVDDGLFVLHTIGRNYSGTVTDPWIERYIFPNSVVPSVSQIAEAAEKYFVLEDWHGFGADYDRTLMQWHANFESTWNEIADRYDERFHRMWRYYLLSCAGSFRARKTQLWQIVFSPSGVPGGYQAPR